MNRKYVIETKKGMYIKEATIIFDKECDFLSEACLFKDQKAINKFFMFRDKNKYKVYKIELED